MHSFKRDEPTTAVPLEDEGRSPLEKPTLPILAGLAGAAMTVAVVATMKRSVPSQPNDLPMSAEERNLLKTILARGEEKGWNLAYDEHFIFTLWPALKAIAG